jgi:SpoVK/Ycf46/Vps4 family AAA+-type ATPase
MQIDELPSYTIVVAATNHPELLDRAAWRRFQVRLNLPLPTQIELASYIEAFMVRFGEAPGISSLSIAKGLGTVSYAEAEQFCLDVRRRQVLAMGDKNLKVIVSEQLKIWTSEVRAKQPTERSITDADPASAQTSGS